MNARLFVLLLAALTCAPARANVIVVNSLADDFVVNGLCTLREAISNANQTIDLTNGDCVVGDDFGLDVIVFTVSGTITVSSALPNSIGPGPLLISGIGTPGDPNAPCPAWPPTLTVTLVNAGTANYGITFLASNSIVRGMNIAGFGFAGVLIGASSSSSRVQCSFIGTNAAGTVLVPGSGQGVMTGNSGNHIIGTDGDGVNDANEGNLLAGFGGVSLFGSGGNRVAGNLIGTNALGTASIAIGGSGVSIANSTGNIIGSNGDGISDALEGNVIGSAATAGVFISSAGSSNNRVAGNFIGRSRDGSVALPNGAGVIVRNAANNLIGRLDAAGAGNLIASNLGAGVLIEGNSSANVVAGNSIGTNAAGAALGNAGIGVRVGATASGNLVGTQGDAVGNASQANLIGNNTGGGVELGDTSANTIVAGNAIGRVGAVDVGNGTFGVRVSGSATGSVIGTNGNGSGDALESNLIAANAGPGVEVAGGTANRVRGNSIDANLGLGIDLAETGVTANDAGDGDTGPNGRQNSPLIASVTPISGMLRIAGTLNSAPSTVYELEFFVSLGCDPSGFGEGAASLGSLVTTATDGNGDVAFEFDFAATPGELADPPPVAMTATGSEGTSEFSNCVRRDVVLSDGFE